MYICLQVWSSTHALWVYVSGSLALSHNKPRNVSCDGEPFYQQTATRGQYVRIFTTAIEPKSVINIHHTEFVLMCIQGQYVLSWTMEGCHGKLLSFISAEIRYLTCSYSSTVH